MTSKSTKVGGTTAATSEPSWIDVDPGGEGDGPSLTATDSDAQQLDTVAEGVVVDPDVRAAVQRARTFIEARGYQQATADIIGYIAANAVGTADLNVVILEQMALRILNAETPDDILDPFGTVKGQAMLDRPLWVEGLNFLESDQADGFPWYVSFQVKDQNSGALTPVTVGGEKLVIQAAVLDMKDAWPLMLTIHKADKPTKKGFYPLELRPVKSLV